MCFDYDSSPPVLAGPGAVERTDGVILESADGTRFAAFEAIPAATTGRSILILPDVRGLHPYYRELACRFAEHGVAALAIDYFGRTAGPHGERGDAFDHAPHVEQTTLAGLTADVTAGARHLRAGGADASLAAIGFCFGGRLAFLSATFGLGLGGVIGVHAGLGPRNDLPAPADRAEGMRGRILGLFGGADPSIPAEDVARFDAALTAAGVEHRLVPYPDTPHSFFDRKFEQFAAENASAWREILDFIDVRPVSAS
jgi:carboxymethylenebutenolidase